MNIKKVLSGFYVFIMLISVVPSVNAIEIYKACCNKSDIDAPHEALLYKQHILRLQKDRAVIYNALDLTDEQIKTREECAALNTQIYETKFNELIKESYTLKALILAEVESGEINQQKKVVKNLKQDIDKLFKEEDRVFRRCLTREQRSKYSMIKKLERKDYKASLHKKDYYKSNPRMRPFGNPKPYPVSVN